MLPESGTRPMPVKAETKLADSAAMQEHLRATLFEPESVLELRGPEARALVAGTATGVTTGGCVSMLTTSVGTPSFPASARGAVVLLEDVNEHAYRLDSYLTHLRRAGWGRILTVTSSGVIQPIPNLGLSNTLRAALVGWSVAHGVVTVEELREAYAGGARGQVG